MKSYTELEQMTYRELLDYKRSYIDGRTWYNLDKDYKNYINDLIDGQQIEKKPLDYYLKGVRE
jgi:hypothetical protein